MTQGMALPPIKHFKSGFARMQAFCGDAEVTPIHPFRLERRTSESDAIYEGLYAFDPGALGPHCGTAKLVLYSEKEPEKGDTRALDPKRVIPVLVNEDDHNDFAAPDGFLASVVAEHVSWGWFDWRREGEGFNEGYQSVPVNWGISSERKRAFHKHVAEITGAKTAGTIQGQKPPHKNDSK